MDRLDKIISSQLNITRSEAKAAIRAGRVSVNNNVIKTADFKCDGSDGIIFDGKAVFVREFVYIMMNKPKGVISASEGRGSKTVVDILPDDMKRKGLFPAGRLDKDTTGFILITDDGEFAHNILSPKKHIDKTYIATLDKPFDSAVAEDFKGGMSLGNERLLKADIECVNDDYTVARVVLRQGLYHQIKRMFKKHGITVLELDRVSMGRLSLDKDLERGECRYLTEEEVAKIKRND